LAPALYIDLVGRLASPGLLFAETRVDELFDKIDIGADSGYRYKQYAEQLDHPRKPLGYEFAFNVII
jgi:hypothetical protein